jgi:hypothetical protein
MRSKIKQARNRIGALRLALVSPAPEQISAALPGLQEAVLCLKRVEAEFRDGAPAPYELRRELKLLKNDIRISARLVEEGVAFCREWANLLGAGPSYNQAGQPETPEPLACGGTLSVRG